MASGGDSSHRLSQAPLEVLVHSTTHRGAYKLWVTQDLHVLPAQAQTARAS